jgi:hypothetical protein
MNATRRCTWWPRGTSSFYRYAESFANGMCGHIGADVASGVVHSVVSTAAKYMS